MAPARLIERRAATIAGIVLACLALTPAHAAPARTLRVCADPNNLPFSNRDRAGFENKIVDVVAHDLDARVEYTWWPQLRGFARKTLKSGKCDLWPGVATGVDTLATTAPYYRSSYMFVTRSADHLDIASFDDPRLRTLRIGVQMIGNDATNTPPSHALSRRGIVDNVRGYMVYVDYGKPHSDSPIVDAVANGDIDVALVWGPPAGYFASRSNVPLALHAVPAEDGGDLPMTFDISMGVRKNDAALKHELESALAREHDAIAGILDAYSVPQLGIDGGERPPSAMLQSGNSASLARSDTNPR